LKLKAFLIKGSKGSVCTSLVDKMGDHTKSKVLGKKNKNKKKTTTEGTRGVPGNFFSLLNLFYILSGFCGFGVGTSLAVAFGVGPPLLGGQGGNICSIASPSGGCWAVPFEITVGGGGGGGGGGEVKGLSAKGHHSGTRGTNIGKKF